ncbi:thiazolylpeptide-type bacteriocin [Nocardiopsis xinjiangensis]|uniref:thiazolylpeptide-type bacteriocin n=1 Tax=Nocardiopsis xinjiangensis TaxID=124285 RepID=UPI00034B3381|nr:thiazolylpeptide-type bacteriocin [Nocardiopsis xinjiangensis]
MSHSLSGLRHELEQLESETFEVMDFAEAPEEMLGNTTSTSSTSCCSSCTSCTSTASSCA